MNVEPRTLSFPNYRFSALVNTTLPVAIGAAAFFFLIGPSVLIPTNIGWLLQAGDPAQYYLGWAFFRDSGWSFPIGLNPAYGLGLSNSIVYSDSNPLFAFVFKLFSPWLPEPFQYFGIWLLTCFVLQAWFGWKLTGLMTSDTLNRALGTAFFVFAPPMLARAGGHINLAGHFLILAALYLSFKPNLIYRKLAWGALLVVAAWVHAYLLAMVALLWLATLAGQTIREKLSKGETFAELSTLVVVTGLACWQAGYFTVVGSVAAGGFGYYSMNVLSVIDPNGWSYILPDISGNPGEYEGFNFLGLGVIVGLLLVLPALIAGRVDLLKTIKRYPAVLLALLALTLFAISNSIGIGPYQYSFPLPDPIERLANIFRSSGRMFWPVFYTIYCTLIFLAVRGHENRTASMLLALALVVQVVDISASSGYQSTRDFWITDSGQKWASQLNAPFWEYAAARYEKIYHIPPKNSPPHWKAVAAYAADNGLATNMVYLARIGTRAMTKARNKLAERLVNGQFASDSIYILSDGVLLYAYLNLKKNEALWAHIDGLNVIAPGWEDCAVCPSVDKNIRIAELLPPPVSLGQRILLKKSSHGAAYLGRGWSSPESWGVWSDGPRATMVIPFSSKKRPTSLVLDVKSFVTSAHPEQDVIFLINNERVAEITLNQYETQTIQLPIPQSAYDTPSARNVLRLEFRLPDAASPKELGLSGDTRKLAIGLVAFTLY